jgi:AcrR family transcriptional regulator
VSPSPSRDLRAATPSGQRRSTKDRLLDAAEELFAERGFEGTSMRAVTQAADASVSAANYHFGSKEALVQAALVRRIEPLNRRRLEALDALEAAAGDAAVPVEELLEAFLRPGFDAQRKASNDGLAFRSVAAQLYADPHAMVASLKAQIFGPVIARYLDALNRALPDCTREELALDFQFFIGVMVQVISGETGRESEAGDAAPSREAVLQRMVAFTAAGMRAAARPDEQHERNDPDERNGHREDEE